MPRHDFYHISLKLLLKDSSGKTLVLNAHPEGSYAGYFDLPGGRIDEHEINTPLLEIIRREISEEIGNVQFTADTTPVALGRHIVTADRSATGKEIHVMYIFFEATFLGGDITISDEHGGFRWVDLHAIDPKELFISGIREGIEHYLAKR